MSRRCTVRFADPLPVSLVSDLIGKLHYVSELIAGVAVAADGSSAELELRAGSDAEADEIAQRVRDIAGVLRESGLDFQPTVLVSRIGRDSTSTDDPHPALLASGQLFEYGPGRYGLGPMLVRLVELFQRDVDGLATGFASQPRQFPALIGADLLDRCKYIKSFPQSLNLVAHLRPDSESIRRFAQRASWDGQRLGVADDSLADYRVLLSPSVCFHCYAWLAGQSLPTAQAFTATGKCFRYESGNMRGLERLWDFTMREVIWVGDEEFVLGSRRAAVDRAAELLDRWGLAYEVKTATDPFFIDSYGMQARFQRAFDLKWEILAPLPYRGPESRLAIGSLNFHQDFFGRVFDIRLGGEPARTGCLGFGLERVALAFLAQHGTEPSRWPRPVADAYQSG